MLTRLARAFALLCAVGLAFAAPAAEAQTTAIQFNSEPGDYVGQGQQQTWTDANLIFSVTSSSGQGSRVTISANNYSANVPPYVSLSLEFEGPNGNDLVAGGIYEFAGATSYAPKIRPRFRISGNGRSCGEAYGRFTIHEIVFTGAGQLNRFAADFEQHCGDAVPALLGAIRFNSTRSNLNPFDGATPVYSMRLLASTFGRVTGGGLDCGDGGVLCDATYGTAATITLTATPKAGYKFMAWTGDCSDLPRQATLVVSRRKWCQALFDAIPGSGMPSAFSGGTLLFSDREAVGVRPASTSLMQPTDADFLVSASQSTARFTVKAYNAKAWYVEFYARQGQVLAPGTYDRVNPYYSTALLPGLYVSADSSSCSTRPRFVIHEVAFNNSGQLTRFSADYEVYCGGSTLGGHFGAIRYNATRSGAVPFDGVYPVRSLTIDPPVNGRVIATGIDCGTGGTGDCDQAFAAAGAITVRAVPAPGRTFLGWTGDCSGPAGTQVSIVSRHRCGAIFDLAPGATGPLVDDLRLGSLYFFSQRGDYIGQGQRQIWTRNDSLFTPRTAYSQEPRRGVSFDVSTPDGSYWNVELVAPAGQTLRAGDFLGATRYPFQTATTPGLNISGHGRGCNQLTGRFRIYEVQFDTAGKVTVLAADFEQHCEGRLPALYGAIRYNSNRPTILPFDGEFLTQPDMALDAPVNGAVVGQTFAVAGWALNKGESTGTGVDAVHVYAFPIGGGGPIFLGVATYGAARPDVAALYGSSAFTNCGFNLSFTTPLAPGQYLIAAIARDTISGNFNTVRTATVTVVVPVSSPRVVIETPAEGLGVLGSVTIEGWAIDTGALAGTGVDTVHVWAMKRGATAPIFLGVATYGLTRPDVAALYGARFTNAGYRLIVNGLAPGIYTLHLFARSTLSGAFTGATRNFVVTSVGPRMAVTTPEEGYRIPPNFVIAGWAIDGDAPSGTGVDTVHIWALPHSGGPAMFLAALTPNQSRPEVGMLYGARFVNSGFFFNARMVPLGKYTLAIFARSTATGTFNQVKTINVSIE